MASVKDQPQIAARIAQAYADSLHWCSTNAERCGQLVARQLPMLSAEAVTDSLAVAQMAAVPASESRAEVEFLFELLLKKNPALIGGKLPTDDFYSPVGDQP